MLQLHSFQYDDAHDTFQAAVKVDPRCAMALWGDAMAYSHPIWGEEQVQSARAALARVKNDCELRPTGARHLAAARALYGTGDIGEAVAPGWSRPSARTVPSPRTTSWPCSTRSRSWPTPRGSRTPGG